MTIWKLIIDLKLWILGLSSARFKTFVIHTAVNFVVDFVDLFDFFDFVDYVNSDHFYDFVNFVLFANLVDFVDFNILDK